MNCDFSPYMYTEYYGLIVSHRFRSDTRFRVRSSTEINIESKQKNLVEVV